MRKIAIITGTRAEYGLLYHLIKEIKKDPALKLQLLVTGMHLSERFGLTYKEIEKDGFKITTKIPIPLDSDTPTAITKALGVAELGFAKAFEELKSDLVCVLGDRFETFAAVAAATICRIPVAHIGGGDSSEGVIDEALRHAITKMAHLHFTITEEHRKRVIQLGEDPKRVFNFGAPGIDNIRRTKLLSKNEFQKLISFSLSGKVVLVTFHPCTLEKASAGKQFKELLQVLKSHRDLKIIFTKPNADLDGRVIGKLIDGFITQNKSRAVSFVSMGRINYLSALQFVDAVVGNSSSGIVEAPSFKIGTINVGDRQKGRLQAGNVINCEPTTASIQKVFQKLYSSAFQKKLRTVKNPYERPMTAEKIKKVLKAYPLTGILKKHFYNGK